MTVYHAESKGRGRVVFGLRELPLHQTFRTHGGIALERIDELTVLMNGGRLSFCLLAPLPLDLAITV